MPSLNRFASRSKLSLALPAAIFFSLAALETIDCCGSPQPSAESDRLAQSYSQGQMADRGN